MRQNTLYVRNGGDHGVIMYNLTSQYLHQKLKIKIK